MKYKDYILMSKEHREEYDYRFRNDLYAAQVGLGAIALLSKEELIIIVTGLLSIFCYVAPLYLEHKWLKEKGYKK